MEKISFNWSNILKDVKMFTTMGKILLKSGKSIREDFKIILSRKITNIDSAIGIYRISP